MLLNGDCLELMKEIPDKSVDMVLTDPPYGTTACKWDSIVNLELMWKQLARIIKPNRAIVLFGAQPFTSALGSSNIKNLKYSWVWIKSRPTGHLNAKRRPLTGFEDILVFSYAAHRYFPLTQEIPPKKIKNSSSHLKRNSKNVTSTVSGGLRDVYVQSATGYPRGLLDFKSEGKPVHPTQKPVPLLEYLVKTYTLEGETVLDFTMGSGSTGVACKNLNRKFIGIEKDEKYYEIAVTRIKNAIEKAKVDFEKLK